MKISEIQPEKLESILPPDQRFEASRMDKLMTEFRSWSPFKHKTFSGHKSPAWGCAITSDNQFVFSSGEDKVIIIWNLSTNEEKGRLLHHSGNPNFLFLIKNDSILVSAGWDGLIIFWNWRQEQILNQINTGNSNILSAVVSSDEAFIVVGCGNNRLKVFDLNTYRELSSTDCEGVPFGLCFNSDCSQVVIGTSLEVLAFYNFYLGINGTVSSQRSAIGVIQCLTVSLLDKYLFIGTRTNLIKIFSYEKKIELHSFNSHQHWVRSLLCVAPHYLISCSADKSLKIFNIETKTEILTIEGNDGFINGMCLSKDLQYLLTCSSANNLKIWKIGTLERKKVIINSFYIFSLAICADESKGIAGCNDSLIRVVDPKTQSFTLELSSHSKAVKSVKISKNQEFFASCSEDSTVIIWNFKENTKLSTFQNHSESVEIIDFTPDSAFLASAGHDFKICLFRLSTLQLEREIKAHTDTIFDLKFQKDNQSLISVGADKTIKIWNIQTGENLQSFETRTSFIDSCDLTEDEKFFVFSCREGEIFLWNWEKFKKISKFHFGGRLAICVSFMKNCQNFGCIYEDGTIRVINYIDLKVTCVLKGHPTCGKSLIFSNDGERLYSICNSGYFIQWNLSKIGSLEIIDVSSPIDSFIYTTKVKEQDFPPDDLIQSTFSPLKINLAHVYSYLGLKKYLLKALKSGVDLRTDDDNKSPLHYAIERKSQQCVEVILSYLIQLKKENFEFFLNNIRAIRGDFVLLLENRSENLEEFFETIFYRVPNTINFGVPVISLPNLVYSDTEDIEIGRFVRENNGEKYEKEELIEFKTLPFAISHISGSSGSIDLLDSITKTKNTKILSTEFVITYLRNKWEGMWFFILLLTLINWSSLVIMIYLVFLSYEEKHETNEFLLLAILFFIFNGVLVLYEICQLVATGVSYFKDIWNLIDISRIIVSVTWIVTQIVNINFPENYEILTWFMVSLNFMRGLTGFRAFDQTRHYTKLIIRSVFESLYFLMIFFYSTLAFGVLYYASKYNEMTRFSIWRIPYELNNGSFENSSYFTLEYMTFILASIVNVIIILNLLISILGDTFEEFQSESKEIDCLEMAEMVLEIETLMVWRRKENQKHFIHKCQVLEQAPMKSWEGRLNAISEMIEGLQDKMGSDLEIIKSQNAEILKKISKLDNTQEG